MRPMNPMKMSSRRIVQHNAMYAPPANTLQASSGETRIFRIAQTSRNGSKLQEFSNLCNGGFTCEHTRSPDTEVEELMKEDGDIDSNFSNLVSYTGSSRNDSYSSHGSVMYIDRASWDSESSIMSACDQVQYSERLKEFENMIAPCAEQGEYVYLGQVNGFTDKKITTSYSDIGKSENSVRVDSVTNVKDIQENYVNKTDKNGNFVDFSADMNIEDDDGDLKKIIQECLWYFHSQVESRRSQVQNIHRGSKTKSEGKRSYLHTDQKYRSRGQVPDHRPRSMTDAQEHPDVAARQRLRSVTDAQMLQCHPDSGNDYRKTERDVGKQGDGLSLLGDVSRVATRHGSPHQSRFHTLPPRIPVNQFSPPLIRSDRRGNTSLRRKPHLARRSKSSFGMFALPTEPYNHNHTQQDHVSTGRMFIEDVLHDISDPKVTDVDDKTTTEGQYVELRKDVDNSDITYDPNHNKVSTPIVPNSGVYTPLIRSVNDFQGMTNTANAKGNGLRHFKSLSTGSFLPKTFPNFTKNSKFIRNLRENKASSGLKQSVVGHNSDLKIEVEPVVVESESSTSDLGVFDIVGEDSGCRYPWQRDAFTQYEAESVKMVESESNFKNDSKTNQGSNKSSDNIVKRQRLFRGQRPHSVGCIDTSTYDADLESISQLQNSARARISEPFIQSTLFRKRPSQGTSEESGSTSNLESILENPAEITLRHSAHRNVLSSPSVSPEMWLDRPGDGTPEADDAIESVFDSPLGRRKKPARNRSSGSITSGSEESDNEPSQPLARRGRRSAIVDTKNCGDVSPTTLSPEASPSNSSDEGENASGRSGRRRSSANNLALNVYPGDLLVQEHHKKLIKRNTIADFYSGRNGSTQNLTDDNKKQRQPFSLLKLMKARSKESLAQLSDVLQTLKPTEFKDNNLAAYKNVHWTDLVASADKQGSNGDLQDISAMERKRRESVWELFKSECVFLIDHLMVLKNCFLEPLKKLQVEGFLMYTEPSEIFSNLEELCYVSYTFCKDFIGSLVKDMSVTDFGRTSVLIKALQRFSAHSKDGSVYHTYCLNYSNALTYLEKLRKNDDFCEFEKWCEQDPRCNRLQLADLLIGPMQHCTKLPLLLHNIKKYTEDPLEKRQVAESIDKVEMSLEQLEDKMKWLKNFERVQEIQRQLVWPTVCDLDPRAFIPDNLKSKLLRQPCARLLACPTRQLLHEGTITLTETTKTIDAYMFLFDDILLLAKMKKRKQKQTSSENTTTPLTDTYTVHRQPIALDRLGIHDLSSQEATANGMKFAFVLVQISRFQQIIDVFTLQAQTESIKTTWLTKIKNAKSQFQSVSRANSIKEDADTNSLQGKPYHGKSKSIDTVFL